MKRFGVILALLATIAFAGPVSANHEVWKANLDDDGIDGYVRVALASDHEDGNLIVNLHGLKDGDLNVDVNAGGCGNFQGHIVRTWAYNRDFIDGTFYRKVALPEGSAYYFKDGIMDHNKVSVTVTNEGMRECVTFHKIHP